ncbi:MAG TPA: hypothetical protein VIB48_03190 [Acidimicrobiia bacterium]
MSSTVRMPPPDVWGVGRVVVAGEMVPWPVSAADIDAEIRSQTTSLRRLGVREGDVVVICSKLSEAIHAFPLESAANALGARYSSTDATEFDAFRTAAMIEQVSPSVVIGVNREVVTGLRTLGRELHDVFAPVAVVATVDDDAHDALAAAGLAPRRWIKLGPTSAFECEARAGAHFDGSRWRVDAGEDGGLAISVLVPALTACEGLGLGLTGVVDPARCACGSDDPRVRLGA